MKRSVVFVRGLADPSLGCYLSWTVGSAVLGTVDTRGQSDRDSLDRKGRRYCLIETGMDIDTHVVWLRILLRQ